MAGFQKLLHVGAGLAGSFKNPVILEIVGFWERGYLERKIAKLNRAGRTDLIVLVSERTKCGREHFLIKGQEPPYQLIFFKGKPQLGPILAALEKCTPRVPENNVIKEFST